MNLVEGLSREIQRVTKLQSQYEQWETVSGVNVRPVLTLIGQALERAQKAMGRGDIEEMAKAMKDLEGFEK